MKVQLNKNDGNWWHYMFNKPIPANQLSKFKLKIVQANNRDMLIGVTDYTKNKDNRYSYGSSNKQYLCYYGGNGYKYPESTQ